MSVDQMGTPDTTTDAQRMAPPAAAPASPDMSQAPLDNPQSPVTPAAGAPPAAAPQDNKPHPLASALNAVLKGATGGDVYYTAPDGTRKLAPQSNATLGKTLIAATLAGLLSKDDYRETKFGPVRDFAGSAGNAAEAASGVVNAARNKPQQLSDLEQTKKMMTIQNNSNLIALQSASARLKHANQEANSAAVTEGLTPFKDYEALRTANNDPNQPKAFLSQGLTHDQVLATGPDGKPAHKLTDSNVIQDGWTQKWNEDSHQMEPEPTYAVLNPDLKDVTLPKNVTDMLNKVNSQWKDIHQIVGGTVKVPVNAYVSAMHDYSAVMQGQQVLDTLNKTVNGADAEPLSVDAVAAAARASKDKGQNILPALYQLTHAVAGNNLPEDGQRPDNLLHTLLTSPNGGEVLKLIGLTPDEAMKKADSINAERVKQLALAKMGGIGDKAPAPDGMSANLLDQIGKSNLTPDAKAALTASLPSNSGGVDTTRQVMTVGKSFQTAVAAKNREDIQNGDPQVLKTTASNMIEGDNSSIKDLMTSRSNVKATANNILQEEARARGLDPTRYTLSAQQAKSDTFKQYSEPNQKIGAQLQSFGKLLGHINEGYEASNAWTRSGSPLLNHGIGWLAENAQNDQDFKRFQSEIIAPAKEYMNFLNQNRAEHESDIKSLEAVINPSTTPAGVLTALTSFAKTADIQAAQLGRGYIQTVGTTYPVVDPTGTAILDRLLGKGKSQAAAVSAQIPKGWQGNQARPITDKNLLNTIFNAAGRDAATATRIAKENGWIVPQQ